MYTGAALSFGLIRACHRGLVLYSSVLSDAGDENDDSSAISERLLLTPRCVLALPMIKISSQVRWTSDNQLIKGFAQPSLEVSQERKPQGSSQLEYAWHVTLVMR